MATMATMVGISVANIVAWAVLTAVLFVALVVVVLCWSSCDWRAFNAKQEAWWAEYRAKNRIEHLESLLKMHNINF